MWINRRVWLSGVGFVLAVMLTIGGGGSCDFNMDSETEEVPLDEVDKNDEESQMPDGIEGEGESEGKEVEEEEEFNLEDFIPDDTGESLGPWDDGEVGGRFARSVMSADGLYLASPVVSGSSRCLTITDLEAGTRMPLVDICDVRWLAAAPHKASVFALDAAGMLIMEIALETGSVVAQHPLDSSYSTLDISPDGNAVVATNKPVDPWSESQYEWRTYDMVLRRMAVVFSDGPQIYEQVFPYAIRSIAFSPVDKTIMIAMSWWKEDGLPEAVVSWFDPFDGVVEETIVFPNCADEIAIQPGGEMALLAPRQCFVHPVILEEPEVWEDPEDDWDEWDDWDDADPTSVIDLSTRSFVGNLPGFGPIQFASDGRMAVAFSRQETMMKQWNVFQQEVVGLILIRMEDLYWRVLEYGHDEPDFFFLPGDTNLFLHDREDGRDRVVKLDLLTDVFTEYGGEPMDFEGRAVTMSGDQIFVPYDGVIRTVSALGCTVETLLTTVAVSQVFTRPQDDFLVTVEADFKAVWLLSPVTGEVLDQIL